MFNDLSSNAIGRQLIRLIFYRDGKDELHFYLMDVGMASEIGPRPAKEYLYPNLSRRHYTLLM